MKQKNIIGSKLKLLRKERNISQKEIVAKLNLLGIQLDEIKLSRIEHFNRAVLDYELLALSKIFEIDIKDFFD